MSVKIIAEISVPDYHALSKLSKALQLPVKDVAGIVICESLDHWSSDMILTLLHQTAPMYKARLTIRAPNETIKQLVNQSLEEATPNEPNPTSNP